MGIAINRVLYFIGRVRIYHMNTKKQGFIRVEFHLYDGLLTKPLSLVLYCYLFKSKHLAKEPFIYSVNKTKFKVKKGEYFTSWRKLEINLHSSRRALKKAADHMSSVTPIKYEESRWGVHFKRIPIAQTPERVYDDHPHTSMQNDNMAEVDRSHKDRDHIDRDHKDRDSLCARECLDKSIDRLPSEIDLFDSDMPQSFKNVPIDPLDDPNDIRFDLDQRFDPRVRQSVWRQLAVDWYFWATNNGSWRALTFSMFVDCVRAMIDSGQVDDVTLREMFDKVVKANVFWQRNFRRIDKWNSYFSTGETRLGACLSDLDAIKKKQINPKTNDDDSVDVYFSGLR